MDKCQQFIDKVGELRFLKIKERQVNKFNRLMLKKKGNITWFSAVSLVNPQAGSSGPQVASTSVFKAGSSREDSVSWAAIASSPQTVSQAVSSPHAGSSWEGNTSQVASVSSPQTVNTQAGSSMPSQAENIDPQMVSATVFQPVNSWEDSAVQAASTSSPQTISSQAVSSSQAISFQEDSASHAIRASSQTPSANSQGANATLPQDPQASRQSNSTNTP